MACFSDEEDVYDRLGRLMQALIDDEELGPRLAGTEVTVRWDYSDPGATITARLASGATRVDLGPSELEPDVVVAMDADVAHRFWLGELNVGAALSRGQLRASGPVDKILALMPLTRPASAIYRQQLIDAGRADLTAA